MAAGLTTTPIMTMSEPSDPGHELHRICTIELWLTCGHLLTVTGDG